MNEGNRNGASGGDTADDLGPMRTFTVRVTGECEAFPQIEARSQKEAEQLLKQMVPHFPDYESFLKQFGASWQKVNGSQRKHYAFSSLRLTELAPSVARVFIQQGVDSLTLYGSNEISEELAAVLSEHDGFLYFRDLEELRPPAARMLFQHSGHLDFKRLKSFSDELADALAAALQEKDAAIEELETSISIPSVRILSPKAISVLSKCDNLVLGITELDPTNAECFSNHDGNLHFHGLGSLSPEVAEALIGNYGDLAFDALDEISDGVARILSQHRHSVSLGRIRITVEVARALIAHRGGQLTLNLAEPSEEVIETLAKYEGNLQINGIEMLTPRMAAALGRHEGNLTVFPARMSDEAVLPLLQHRGLLESYWDDVEGLSPEAIDLLNNHEGVEL